MIFDTSEYVLVDYQSLGFGIRKLGLNAMNCKLHIQVCAVLALAVINYRTRGHVRTVNVSLYYIGKKCRKIRHFQENMFYAPGFNNAVPSFSN